MKDTSRGLNGAIIGNACGNCKPQAGEKGKNLLRAVEIGSLPAVENQKVTIFDKVNVAYLR